MVEADSYSISNRAEQEEALVALIDHRSKEVDHLRKRLAYYQSQLEESEHRLNESLSKLARLRALPSPTTKKQKLKPDPDHDHDHDHDSPPLPLPLPSKVKLEPNASPAPLTLAAKPKPKPKLLIPSVSVSVTTQPPDSNSNKGTKRKLELKHHQELIPLVRTNPNPSTFRCDSSNNISSQHKRKLRTIALSPLNDQLFVTSALDGVVNLWQVQSKGSAASLVSNTDCSSHQRRWPEDMAWHPNGNSVFCAYSADAKDSQISILHLDPTTQGRDRRVTFLEDKPHMKGIINSISFIPWEKTCFVTGGSDHGVILWDEKEDNVWKPKALHRNNHSSAVMGVAGMQQKNIVLSAGADKRIIGFDVNVGRADFKHQIDTKCMSVLPNPCDFNLFMVHAGTLEKQLRLFDIRLRQTEIHSFGWKQESSESQSALINQSWSPDGLYITSGSADPMIHIFDIRYNASKPSQSIRAHQKRVFKAVWLKSLRLLVSISSDLHIGLHKIA